MPDAAPPREKRFRLGTHRVVDPGETLRRLAPKLAALGITRIADITGLDYVGIPVAMAVRPLSRSLSVAQGKGATRDAARASAAMEAAEASCAERPPLPIVRRSRRSFGRKERFAAPPHLQHRRLSGDDEIGWILGEDLLTRRDIWVPDELVRLDFALPRPEGHGYFVANSNGLASGNTLAEATLHGLCETIERDAVALWRRLPPAERAARRIDPARVADDTVALFLARLREARMSLAVFDITSEIAVPAFYCIIDDTRGRPPFLGRFAGAGCHPSVGVALSRALAEAAQSRLTFIVGAREDIPRESYAAVGWHENFMRLLAGDAGLTDDPPDVAPRAVACDGATSENDVAAVLARLAASGIGSAILVDLSDRELDLACVRVIVPALEGTADCRPGPRARSLMRETSRRCGG